MAIILDCFNSLTDPRREHRKQHKLSDIIFITIAAVICGADDWYEIEEYGKHKQDWLKTILELPYGIPSHDTFNRVFSILDPAAVLKCFMSWVQSIVTTLEGQIINFDGKRLCNSGQGGSKSVIHMVSAWSGANKMVLGQVKVDDKSNEITAIPELLDLLMVKGSLVTIDAMGCQRDIAAKIIEKQADYMLAVKDNQASLHDDIKEAFEHEKNIETHIQSNMGHGRIEKRTCSIITNIDWICSKEGWEGLQTLVAIESRRIQKATGIVQTENRYYISSKKASAEVFNHAARQHWGIENNLHWTLDVVFNEDGSTKRAGDAAENFSSINKIALNLLNQDDYKSGARKVSMKIKRKRAGWDNDYLLHLLNK